MYIFNSEVGFHLYPVYNIRTHKLYVHSVGESTYKCLVGH